MNNFFFWFLFYIIITLSSEQQDIYCHESRKCNNCTICGSDTNDYCSCSFSNFYCLDDLNNLTMIPDFIVPYDGCLKNSNDLLNICGDSNIGLDIGSNETINFKSSSKSNFICYYSIRKIMNNNNDIKISVYKEGNEKIYFTMVFVIYYNYDQIRITTLSDMVTYSNFFWLNESKVEKISLFINILDGKDMNKIYISSAIENYPIIKITYETNSNKKTKGIIFGIIIGTVFIIIVIIIVVIIKRYTYKPKIIIVNNSEKKPPIYIQQIKSNKLKVDDLFKKELTPKMFSKKDIINDCYKCTICLEEFKDGKSIIVTTKCGHSFHFNCFKNWVYKNILSPKCPNCNHPIIDCPNIKNQNNISIPSTINTNNPQVTENTNTFTVTNY